MQQVMAGKPECTIGMMDDVDTSVTTEQDAEMEELQKTIKGFNLFPIYIIISEFRKLKISNLIHR